jgi:hypothetical protein
MGGWIYATEFKRRIGLAASSELPEQSESQAVWMIVQS